MYVANKIMSFDEKLKLEESCNKQTRSTEGCSKFKNQETSSGEIFLDIRTHASPKVDRTRCPDE